jgi:hypothetical protein
MDLNVIEFIQPIHINYSSYIEMKKENLKD